MNHSTLRPILPLVLAFLGLIGSGCATSSSHSGGAHADATADTGAIAKTLAKLDDEWSAAASTRDAHRVASYYAEDAVAYPPNEPAVVGRGAAERVWAAYFSEPSLTLSWKTVYAEAAESGELGFTAGTYVLRVNGPDGRPMTELGKYLCTWRKQKDGTWKATHDMWNADSK